MMFSVFEETKKWAAASKITLHANQSVGSTNEWAKSEASSVDDRPQLYICEHQTEGRGRGENTWHDTGAGNALLSSWSFALPFAPQPVLSPALGLAVYRALAATWSDLPFGLKAPNDVYAEQKKVAGILLETVQQGAKVRLIMGIGMNIWSAPEIAAAGSLVDLVKKERLTAFVFSQFLDRLLFEITTTFQESKSELSPNQRAILTYAINQYAPKKMVKDVFADGTIVMVGGSKVHWSTL